MKLDRKDQISYQNLEETLDNSVKEFYAILKKTFGITSKGVSTALGIELHRWNRILGRSSNESLNETEKKNLLDLWEKFEREGVKEEWKDKRGRKKVKLEGDCKKFEGGGVRKRSEYDVENLSQIVSELKTRYNLKLVTIAKGAGVKYSRLRNLLCEGVLKKMREEEMEAIWEFWRKMEGGDPKKEKKNSRGRKEIVSNYDVENLSQLVIGLKVQFNLRLKNIAELAGMKPKRLRNLYGGYVKLIKNEEVEALCGLWEKLEERVIKDEGKSKSGFKRKRENNYDIENLSQLVFELKARYNLTLATIASRTGIKYSRMRNLLCKGTIKNMGEKEMESLWQLWGELENEIV